jgi:hypothetical protein
MIATMAELALAEPSSLRLLVIDNFPGDDKPPALIRDFIAAAPKKLGSREIAAVRRVHDFVCSEHPEQSRKRDWPFVTRFKDICNCSDLGVVILVRDDRPCDRCNDVWMQLSYWAGRRCINLPELGRHDLIIVREDNVTLPSDLHFDCPRVADAGEIWETVADRLTSWMPGPHHERARRVRSRLTALQGWQVDDFMTSGHRSNRYPSDLMFAVCGVLDRLAEIESAFGAAVAVLNDVGTASTLVRTVLGDRRDEAYTTLDAMAQIKKASDHIRSADRWVQRQADARQAHSDELWLALFGKADGPIGPTEALRLIRDTPRWQTEARAAGVEGFDAICKRQEFTEWSASFSMLQILVNLIRAALCSSNAKIQESIRECFTIEHRRKLKKCPYVSPGQFLMSFRELDDRLGNVFKENDPWGPCEARRF